MTTDTQNQPQDLSIEEILASIRQIISDDDDPSKQAAPAPAPEPDPVADVEDDILNLTEEMLEQPKPDPVIDFGEPEPEPVVVKSEPVLTPKVPEPEPDQFIEVPTAPVVETQTSDDSIFTDSAAAATLGAFSKLAENVLIEKSSGVRPVSGPSLEEIVRDLLRPMLREWVDRNVPRIVERLVQEELEKLARRARED